MLRGEAAAMTAYVAQGKRIPRRGEVCFYLIFLDFFFKITFINTFF